MFSTSGIQHQAETAGPTNFGGSLYSYSPYKNSATATVTFFTNGAIQGANGGDTGESSITDTVSGDSWFSPNQTSIGNSYWIRATVTSGSTPSGSPVGSWEPLSSDVGWFIYVAGESQNDTSTLSVQVSSSGTGTPVVASGVVDLDVGTGSFEVP